METESYRYGQKIKALSRAFDRAINATLAEMDLTCAQGMALAYLTRHADQDVYPRDLERHFKLSHPTVSGILQRLEAKGYITFATAAHDRRYKRIAVTQKALDNQQRNRAWVSAIDEQLVRGFTAAERQLFWDLLSRAAENVSPPKEEPHHD